eukprot:CAMPEP_0170197550 /NCGR_PEP_ID=MMETSP0040_2-20121228/66647_1 /TAXON_ID=641309 /ORGANISM="Lotharella oceanica, Strain CCMP622" /LENGTH=40 /DNA_ID= /DNA_START= /DNA_END= /DNA_ORIENTATION=
MVSTVPVLYIFRIAWLQASAINSPSSATARLMGLLKVAIG